jgi:hypothetical protein
MPFGSSFGRIRSPFELPDCTLAERLIAMQIVSIKDRAHITKTMAGNGRNLRFGALGKSEARYCRASKIIEGHANYAGALAGLTPRSSKAMRGPRLPIGRRQNHRAALNGAIQGSL